jgi:hypothetical protein
LVKLHKPEDQVVMQEVVMIVVMIVVASGGRGDRAVAAEEVENKRSPLN